MKPKKRSIILVLIVLTLSGCSEVPGKLLIIEGNYHNMRERHSQAISSYMKALEHSYAEPYAEYALGSVYFAMGEETAALDRFAHAAAMLESSSAAENRELRYRVHYNTGILLFSEGNFAAAADSFREALRTDGGKIDAKRNLELSIRSLERERPSTGGGNGDENNENDGMSILFEYIRQKELNQWRSRDWPEEEDYAGPDY